jgi:hypothetical protein
LLNPCIVEPIGRNDVHQSTFCGQFVFIKLLTDSNECDNYLQDIWPYMEVGDSGIVCQKFVNGKKTCL